jgi:3-oxoacyl-[acyl-carrier protein] reductase
MRGIRGKTVLVTGAASGFGAGIAARFAEEGGRVLVADIDQTAGTAHAAAVGGDFLAMDVADAESVESALADLDRPVDILVNNAGIGLPPTPLTEVDPEAFERLINVNVRSIYNTARAIVPGMRANGGGVILNIASTAGVSPRPGLTWYNASKGWVITATRSMAVELAADNIRVNAINPVAGETPLLSTFMGGDTEENRARFLATIPLGRFSTPDDIASAACFLCSEEAGMITGVALEVDGGRCV